MIRLCWFLIFGALTTMLPSPLPGQQPARRDGNLKAGDVAPDFTVQDVDAKKTVKLSELKGKPVVLLFGSCT